MVALLPVGDQIPRVQQGCMGIGSEITGDSIPVRDRMAALKFGIDLGLTLPSTAEAYAVGIRYTGLALRC
jgi:hypothetical protein